MVQFTPGPWQADRYLVKDTRGDVLFDILGSMTRQKEDEANAQLVSAAPDMLAALKLLVADLAGYEAWERPCHAVDVAVAAIAKAEGR